MDALAHLLDCALLLGASDAFPFWFHLLAVGFDVGPILSFIEEGHLTAVLDEF